MDLLIVRHAIAVERGLAPYERDEERPLTPKGERRMRRAARSLARLDPELDAIYTSPLVRAAQTADLLAEALGGKPKPEVTEMLVPGHAPNEVARWLKSVDGDRGVAVVGHEPGCSELLGYLLAGEAGLRVDFGKGGAARVEVVFGRGAPRATLLWLATPRLLRLAGR